MAPRNLAKLYKTATRARDLAPGTTWAPVVLFLLAVGSSVGVASYVSRAIGPGSLLPVMSGALFAAAALLATIGWRERKAKPDTVSYWDVAGAVTLIGCAAAVMSEPENVMQVFGLRQKN